MRLSIKAKLSISIACIVFVVLLLHMILTYNITKDKLVEEIQQRMNAIAQQINVSVQQSRMAANSFEEQLAEKLHIASMYAADKLPPRIASITNEQLQQISTDIGISHISLLHKTPNGDDITINRSSDPKEIGMSTRQWGYWYQAFIQLFEDKQVWIAEGQKRKYFWSGPFDVSSSNPEHLDKWGYYYDGKRDYIINPFIRDDKVETFFELTKPNILIEQTLSAQSNIVEIAALNINNFKDEPTFKVRSDGVQVVDESKSRVLYGEYTLNHERDEEYIRNALERRKPLFYESDFGSRTIIKGFIPIIGATSYVLNISMDARAVLEALHDQLMRNVAVGIVLLEIVLIGSYMLSGILIRPLQSILNKINMISVGHFNTQLNIDRKDELGILAQRINTMARNLDASTERLRMSYLENRAMKEHLESFINQSNDAIHVTDLKGQIERVNQAFVDMFGWTSEEVLGKQLCNIPEDKVDEEHQIHEAQRHGEYVSNWETTRLTKDGRILDVSVSTSPMYNEGGDCIAWASITRDMTSRKRMEELLRRSEKLTTVGQLAAGVAHEIRNPLTTLKGFLQLQQRTRALNDNHMDMMLAELERINLIVSEFLVLAKPQAIQFQPKDVRRIVTDVVTLLDSQAKLNNVYFATQFDEFVPLVNCEENQLKQVFINVMKNAMEAMPEGGMVEIAVQSRYKGQVVVVIRDHGIGIPAEHLSQLGDPFFTSKECGTGLGLMVSQRIIHNHRGLIDIASEQNCGTEVTISLPAIGMEDAGGGDDAASQPALTAISS